jgi:nickel transport protein
MRWVLVLLLLALGAPADAHELHREVSQGEAVVIRLYYAGGTAFSHESYEVFRKGDDVPFQVGRTDALGRLVFVPDCPGEWRVRVFAEHGHGADFTVETGEIGQVTSTEKTVFDRYARIAVGVAVILAVFGVLRYFVTKSAGKSVTKVE